MDTNYCMSLDPGIVIRGSGIALRIVSDDARLAATCKQVLSNLNDKKLPDAELSRVCLWDFAPEQDTVPAPMTEDNERVLYIVPPAHLEALRQRCPESEGNILLKPVTDPVLRAFLSSFTSSSAPNIESLRASRDEILQHLLRANLRLQQYDQQRTNFIARAVHDFRAPLTALSGFCGLLAEGELGALSPVQQEAIQRMRNSVKRISAMASAMFDLSTSPHLTRKPELREGDILEPIRQALHEVTPVAQDKNIQLRSDQITPPPQPLLFESSQIEQVLVNLLDNASKFVPRQGIIEVRAYPYFHDRRRLSANIAEEKRKGRSQTPNCYRIDIIDNGPGVPSHLIDSVFEEYTSYSGSQDRSGGGLGLAICRLIISRHGGHVWAETSPGGTTFSFVLPFRTATNHERKSPPALEAELPRKSATHS